ncbi:MAG TPA: hypothetical protein VIC57_16715 [Candidatus Dormibacteraeota bacterium]|jgi:hypothetical protein
MSRDESTDAAPTWPRRSSRPPTSRYTIDLERRHRDALRDLARELDTTASTIVRALLDLVEENSALAEQLAERVGEAA